MPPAGSTQTAQADLAGHRGVAARRPIDQQRDQGGDHRDPCTLIMIISRTSGCLCEERFVGDGRERGERDRQRTAP
jgi:hypothetical protein